MAARTKTFVFIHQNMPGQFLHLVRQFVADGHKVYFITKNVARDVPGATKLVYKLVREQDKSIDKSLRQIDSAVIYAQSAARALLALKKRGVTPDMIIGHTGWGEMLFVRDLFPDVPILGYFEYYYRVEGADVNFDPEYPSGQEAGPRLRLRNGINLISLESCDRGISPTYWQWGSYPPAYRSKIAVIHEGVETATLRRPNEARFALPDGRTLDQGQEIVTYVARNLEPYRGFHVFMRAVGEICRLRPHAHVLIVGGDSTSYGRRLATGTYREKALAEVSIDASRVHFLGRVPYATFLNLLHVSSVHVYLTYPFVLSWSMLEAMAAECLVIASKTAPVEEVLIDGRNGILTDFFDHNAIAEKVVRALESPATFRDLRTAARRTVVERYDLNGVSMPKYRALLRDLEEGRAPA